MSLQLACEIYTEADEIEDEVWQRVNEADRLFFRKVFFKALEDGSPPDILPRYIILRDGHEPLALLYFQIIDLSKQGSSGILNLEQGSRLFSFLSKSLSYLFGPADGENQRCIIVGGNALMSGEFMFCHSSSISRDEILERLPGLPDLLKEELSSRGKKVEGVLLKDFYPADLRGTERFEKSNYHLLNVDPNMVLRIKPEWKSFDDYLEAMSSKYRVRVRKILKNGKDFEVRTLTSEEIDRHSEEIMKLYLAVHNRSTVRLSTLHINYFIALNENLQENFAFKAYFLNGEMVGFMSEIFDGDHFEAHYIGLSYPHIKSHSLYQHILIEFIADAFEHKAAFVCFGRTAMEIKSNLGAEPEELYSFVKINNSLLNTVIKPFVPKKALVSWIQRSPFKQSHP